MKRFLFLLFLALSVALLASCGGDPGGDDPEPEPEGDFLVTYIIGDKTIKEWHYIGDRLTYVPTQKDLPRGYTFVCWDNTADRVEFSDLTFTAILTNEERFSAGWLKQIYEMVLMTQGDNANGSGIFNAGSAAFCLALEEYEDPQAGPVRDRLVAQLRRLTHEGQAPLMDALPIWSNPAISAAIALARMTPTVWDEMGDEMHERLDWIMKAFAVTSSFATAEWNNFKTGPGLTGNYSKDWNPNYRLSNVLPIVNAVFYFGADDEGGYDVEKGAKAVNEIIKAFDYDAYIAKFREYGFTCALAQWTSDPERVRPLMMEGKSCSLVVASSPSGSSSGSGAGVRPPKGSDGYIYKGEYGSYSLDNVTGIVTDLFMFNCRGGTIVTGVGEGKTLKNADENPMLGKNGMYFEMSTTGRSSASYSRDDFNMAVCELTLLDAIGIFPTDTQKNETVKILQNGTDDLLYKLHQGYHSFGSTGSGDDYDTNGYGGFHWFRWLWLSRYSTGLLDDMYKKDGGVDADIYQ